MVDPADVPTIRQILEDYCGPELFGFPEMVARLEERENIMVTEIGPRLWAKELDRIIEQI